MTLATHAATMRYLAQRHGIQWVGRFAALGSDIVHWVEMGSGSPVVLLHGYLAWSYTWRRNLAALAQGSRAIALDLRGFGLSSKPWRGAYDFDAQVGWIADFVDHLGLESFVLCGHSMGGEIGMRFAARYPQRVQGLVLANSAGYVEKRLPWLARLAVQAPDLGAVLVRPVWANRRFARRVLTLAYHDPAAVDPVATIGYTLPAHTPGIGRSFLRILRQADFGARPQTPSLVRCPTLLIWGKHDPWTPLEHGERMHREIQGSFLHVFPDAGHMPHEEAAPDFNSLCQQWLAGLRTLPAADHRQAAAGHVPQSSPAASPPLLHPPAPSRP